MAAAEATGEKARAVLLEKPYDAQLPAATVGEKQPASHRREVDETCALMAKAVKLGKAAMAADAAATAADACQERLGNKFLKLRCGSHAQQKAYAAYQAAEAHCQVARADREEAIATALETMAVAREALAVVEAAFEAAEAESDQEEEVWVWHPVDDYHIREETVVPMVLAVSMHAAGYAACAACALLAVQEALRLASVDEEGEKEYHALENTQEFYDFWKQSQLFEDTGWRYEARHLATAFGLGRPGDCAKRCTRCAGSKGDRLTTTGVQEVTRAFHAGERARDVVREQVRSVHSGRLPLLGAPVGPAT